MRESNKRLSEAIFEQVARIGKTVANPKRLELMELLSQSPRTVESLARETGMSQANTSQHLKALRATHLVETKREGTSIWYRLTDDTVADFFRTLRVLAITQLPELDRIVSQYFKNADDLEPVDRKTLIQRARKGEVTVVDVRPYEEYLAGHIPGSVSIPIEELESRLSELPQDRHIVAYCRGPYCIWSGQAVEILQDSGYTARHLTDGLLDWRAHGLRVAVGSTP
ncbi:MAG: rhodanese-related sulfurtransferase/DNA-binding transcriptional ArsR family regulator [Gammaproteobacteria bacterium]|jgi:rhodanese-related sulfurtransferase/DNA-binding transcriptional ArsR family regulator